MNLFNFSKGVPSDLVLRAHNPAHAKRMLIVFILLWILSVVAVWLIASYRAAPQLLALEKNIQQIRSENKLLKKELEETRRKFSVSDKSDQVSRTANESLQVTLRAHEEEIASLRSDIAFYQRLMDGKLGQKGLEVRTLALKPIDGGRGFAFRATLTQNLRKGEVTRGRAEISIEGIQRDKIVLLPWENLPGHEPKLAPQFSFKYFQQLDGSLVLPEEFTPNRIKLALRSEQGDRNEHIFTWSQAIQNGENDDVWQ